MSCAFVDVLYSDVSLPQFLSCSHLTPVPYLSLITSPIYTCWFMFVVVQSLSLFTWVCLLFSATCFLFCSYYLLFQSQIVFMCLWFWYFLNNSPDYYFIPAFVTVFYSHEGTCFWQSMQVMRSYTFPPPEIHSSRHSFLIFTLTFTWLW